MQNDTEKKQIYNERERYRHRVFLMMFEVTAIIALPAFVALFLGKYLDKINHSGNIFVIILLAASFIVSWAIIIAKYIKVSKKIKEIDKKIKDLKKNGYSSNSGE